LELITLESERLKNLIVCNAKKDTLVVKEAYLILLDSVPWAITVRILQNQSYSSHAQLVHTAPWDLKLQKDALKDFINQIKLWAHAMNALRDSIARFKILTMIHRMPLFALQENIVQLDLRFQKIAQSVPLA